MRWYIWSLHADAAGVLYDARGLPHYCLGDEFAVLKEFDFDSDSDGDGSGTLTETLGVRGHTAFADGIGARVAPLGYDGVAEYFARGTAEQRQLIPVLVVAIALGKSDEDERGRVLYYDLDINEDGQVLVNGQDLAPLLAPLVGAE